MTEFETAWCKECDQPFEKSTYQSVWYKPSVTDNLILVSMIPELDFRRKIKVHSKLFCTKACRISFFGKRMKERRRKVLNIPKLIIPDKERAVLTDKQIKESSIYDLREIQLLLRGSSLEK